jgi:flagellar hook-associated protein 2
MATIQVGGLATGLDTSTLIQKLVAVEQRPIQLLQTQQLKLKAQSTAYTDLNTRLTDLKNKADVLRDAGTFFPRSVTSSDSTVATATAAAGTARGTYTITATGLARGSIASSANTVDTTEDSVASGTDTFQFKLGAGGATHSITIDTGTSLDDLVKEINDLNAGVKATVVNTGTSSAPAYKLSMTSNATGSENDIVIVHDGTTLSVSNTQPATDATFTVTGLGDFTRSSNTFSDVIDGVTITLLASAGSTELSIDYDKNGVQSRLQNFINAYNSVIQAIDTQSAVTTGSDGTSTSGAFTGDVDTRMLRQHMIDTLRSTVASSFGSLAEIGITTQKDGTLALDGTMLDTALTDDPQGVSDLVAGPSGAEDSGIADLFYSLADEATTAITGMIAVRQDGLSDSIQRLQDQIDAAQRRADAYQAQLQQQFNNLEQIAAQLQNTGDFLTAQFKALSNSGSSK